MSYNCTVCGDTVPPTTKMKRHVVKRPNGQIEREFGVCATCDNLLRDGHTVEATRKIRRDARGIATPLKQLLSMTATQTEGVTNDA